MNEAEWLASRDAAAVVRAAVETPRASDRVSRLFVAAFWGWQSRRLTLPAYRLDLRRRVRLMEQWAETGRPPARVHATESPNIVFFNASAREAALATAAAPATWNQQADVAAAAVRWAAREVFGNPFRPVPLDPEWLTTTVVALATGIYKERAFERMPHLADALQDVGCEDDAVLAHCRSNTPHVRGCWVVDLLLGKT